MDWTEVNRRACWRTVLLGYGAFWLGVGAMMMVIFSGGEG